MAAMVILLDMNSDRGTAEGVRERRRGARVRQARPVKVYDPMTGRYFAGRTCDVGTTGARLALPVSTPLRPGRPLNIHIGVARGGQPLAHRRQMIPARVIWVERPERGRTGSLEAGIEFEPTIEARLHAA
jgi:hypothetical protein